MNLQGLHVCMVHLTLPRDGFAGDMTITVTTDSVISLLRHLSAPIVRPTDLQRVSEYDGRWEDMIGVWSTPTFRGYCRLHRSCFEDCVHTTHPFQIPRHLDVGSHDGGKGGKGSSPLLTPTPSRGYHDRLQENRQ